MAPTLRVNFAGVEMPNPFMLSSAPPTTTTEMVADCFRQGWGGAVLKTLTYQVELSSNVNPRITAVKDGDTILGFTNFELGSPKPIAQWVEDAHKLKKDWPDRGVFVNMLHTEGLVEAQWREVTRMFTQAGVDGFELNFSCSHGMAEAGGGATIASNAEMVKKVTSWAVEETHLPVMVKLPAMVTDLPGKALAAQSAGATAIAAINTLNALPGVNIRTFAPIPEVEGKGAFQGLSGRAIKPVGLRSVAQIAKAVDIPVSGIGGIYSWRDAVEYILCGASSLQVCSAVMEYGYRIVEDLCAGVLTYMEEMGFETISDFCGLALPNITKHNDLNRACRLVAAPGDNCVGCGRCVATCANSGYTAIRLDDDRMAQVDREKCDGCGLCAQVCPITSCMTMQKKAQ